MNSNHHNNAGDGDGDGHAAPADQDVPYSSEFVPPESFWLSKDSEFDWFDRNAFLERKESTKGNNSSYSRSNSQKFSVNLKSKPAILGLPKPVKNTHVDSSRNRRQCKVPTVRLFPKRSGSSGRTTVTEPSSPKVSCIGRVRSKRCPSRRRSVTVTVTANVNVTSSSASSTQPKSAKNEIQQRKTGTGIISRITSLFRSEGNRRRKGNKTPVKVNEQLEKSYSRKNTVKPVNSEPASPAEPPALGGVNRFASGRRSVSWIDDIEAAGRRSVS